MPAFTVYYQANKLAYMDLKTLFFDKFVPSVENFMNQKLLPVRAGLCPKVNPSESEFKFGDIKAMFLPLQVTTMS